MASTPEQLPSSFPYLEPVTLSACKRESSRILLRSLMLLRSISQFLTLFVNPHNFQSYLLFVDVFQVLNAKLKFQTPTCSNGAHMCVWACTCTCVGACICMCLGMHLHLCAHAWTIEGRDMNNLKSMQAFLYRY